MSLTTPEVAGLLGRTPGAVRQLAHRGRLTPLRPGAHPLRFADQAVADLLQSRWWRQQRTAGSQVDDAWAEVDDLLAAQATACHDQATRSLAGNPGRGCARSGVEQHGSSLAS